MLTNRRYAAKSTRGFVVYREAPAPGGPDPRQRRPTPPRGRPRRPALLRPIAAAMLLVALVAHGTVALQIDGTVPFRAFLSPASDPPPAVAEPPAEVARGVPAVTPRRWTEDSEAFVAPAPSPPVPAPPVAGMAPSQPTFDPEIAAELQEAVDRALGAQAVPGLSVAVVLPSGAVWSGGSGVTDFRTDEPVGGETRFTIASITKTFVAALTLRLAEEGILDLDDPLSRWVEDTPNGDEITIRQLLSHKSGVADFFRDGSGLIPALLEDPRRTWKPHEVLKYAGEPYWDPGEGWAYSNSNYVLLGLVIREATGTTVAEAMRSRLLDPLGLDQTFLQPDETPDGPMAVGHAGGIDANGDGRPDPVSAAGAVSADESWVSAAWTAGGMVSSASDLAAWSDHLFGGDVVDPDSLQAMVSFDRVGDYGLGIQRKKLGRYEAWGHTGLLRGYTGAMLYFPRQDVTVVVLANQEHANFEAILADRVGGRSARSILQIAFAAATAEAEAAAGEG